MIDVAERLNQLQADHPALCLYALVDGAQYETDRQARLIQNTTCYPLFTGTPDAALAHAGPWLVDVAGAAPSFLEDLATLEQETPSAYLRKPGATPEQRFDELIAVMDKKLEGEH